MMPCKREGSHSRLATPVLASSSRTKLELVDEVEHLLFPNRTLALWPCGSQLKQTAIRGLGRRPFPHCLRLAPVNRHLWSLHHLFRAQTGFPHSRVQRMKSSEIALNDSSPKNVVQTPI